MIALLSDVHGNLVALEAVLAEVPADAELWVMGDTAGYGPDPSDVLALLRSRGARIVAGNHDLAVAGRIDVDDFNPDAAAAVRLHRSWLSAEERDALGALPLVREEAPFTLVHGSVRDPVWEYVFDAEAARASIEIARTSHCLNGHTHLPAIFELDGRRVRVRRARTDETCTLAGTRLLLNPGSVGQPRDGDARAAWAAYEPEGGTVTFRRTSYDVDETQRRMRRRGLPPFLADRLALGL